MSPIGGLCLEESSKTYSDPLTSLVSTLSYGIKSLETAFAVVLIFVQISSPLPFLELNPSMISPAITVLHSPDTKIAKDEKESILGSIPTDLQEKASFLYVSLLDGKGGLQSLLESIKDKDLDKVSVYLASSLDIVAELELLQAPGLSFLLPKQYLTYPRKLGTKFGIKTKTGTEKEIGVATNKTLGLPIENMEFTRVPE
ncbi:hypothetical protein GIB67_011033 [Kingdonia uniflora]|uniref:Uncharacterized protein n=1 Tax=Kingdonia uniflora TaxID=39325 RepID=A0A7J7L6I2_9MAGN|nr:hypothetical protein GIB67_011033 [Kingdonia uniflora]